MEQEVLELDRQRGEALQRKDIAYLDDLYAEDWSYITPFGFMVTSKKAYLEWVKNAAYETLRYDDVKARAYGNDTVVLTLKNTVEAKGAGESIGGAYLYTRVYVKENGRWKFVAQQGTLCQSAKKQEVQRNGPS